MLHTRTAKSACFMLLTLVSSLTIAATQNGACIAHEDARCSGYLTYKVSPDMDFELAEATLAGLDQLQILKGLADKCIATFTEYACQDVYAKCIGENVGDGLQYACKTSCEKVLEDCGSVFKQFNRQDDLPKCDMITFYGVPFDEENCNSGVIVTAANATDTTDTTTEGSAEQEDTPPAIRPAALDIIVPASGDAANAFNCDSATGLCIKCPVLPYFYKVGAAAAENKLYLSVMLASWISAFIPVVLMALNPTYRTYPGLYLFMGCLCLLLIFTVISWDVFFSDADWIARACQVLDQVPNVSNNMTCLLKSVFCCFFVGSGLSWVLVVMTSLHLKVGHRSNWMEDHLLFIHALVWIPPAAISLGIYFNEEASYIPGLFCYPLGETVSKVYFIYLLVQSILCVILFAFTMIHSVHMSHQNRTLVSITSTKSAAFKRAKQFVRPLCLVLWVTALNLVHTFSTPWVQEWVECIKRSDQNTCAAVALPHLPDPLTTQVCMSLSFCMGVGVFLCLGTRKNLYFIAWDECLAMMGLNSTRHGTLKEPS